MQEAQAPALCQPRGWGEGRREVQEGGDLYTYDWFMPLCGRDQQNVVKQLYSN